MFYSAHKGVTAFLLRKSAILKKARATPKEFEVDFSVMDRPNEYYDEVPIVPQNKSSYGYQNTVEMEPIEEKKE